MDYSEKTLSELAREIKRDWKKVWFGAVPYLDAMRTIEKLGDDYGADSGASIVAYFLANAATWRGEVAKAIKAELNIRLKKYYKGNREV